MTNFTSYFWCNESGAVTVDWVVLAAALVGLSVSIYFSIDEGVFLSADKVRDKLTETAATDFSVTVSEEGEIGEDG